MSHPRSRKISRDNSDAEVSRSPVIKSSKKQVKHKYSFAEEHSATKRKSNES